MGPDISMFGKKVSCIFVQRLYSFWSFGLIPEGKTTRTFPFFIPYVSDKVNTIDGYSDSKKRSLQPAYTTRCT